MDKSKIENIVGKDGMKEISDISEQIKGLSPMAALEFLMGQQDMFKNLSAKEKIALVEVIRSGMSDEDKSKLDIILKYMAGMN